MSTYGDPFGQGIIAEYEEMQGRRVPVYRLGHPNTMLADGRPGYYVSQPLIDADPGLVPFLRMAFGLVRIENAEIPSHFVQVFAPEVAK